MQLLGHLYENPTKIYISDKLPLLCEKGLKLTVVNDCFDESYLHEKLYHSRTGLVEKKLIKGSVVEVLGCWANFYGQYIKCSFNNETFDINPKNLSFSWDLNK